MAATLDGWLTRQRRSAWQAFRSLIWVLILITCTGMLPLLATALMVHGLVAEEIWNQIARPADLYFLLVCLVQPILIAFITQLVLRELGFPPELVLAAGAGPTRRALQQGIICAALAIWLLAYLLPRLLGNLVWLWLFPGDQILVALHLPWLNTLTQLSAFSLLAAATSAFFRLRLHQLSPTVQSVGVVLVLAIANWSSAKFSGMAWINLFMPHVFYVSGILAANPYVQCGVIGAALLLLGAAVRSTST